jgi:hypothetical protein
MGEVFFEYISDVFCTTCGNNASPGLGSAPKLLFKATGRRWKGLLHDTLRKPLHPPQEMR